MSRHDLCRCDAAICVHRLVRLHSTRLLVAHRWNLKRRSWQRLLTLQRVHARVSPIADVIDIVDVAMQRGYGLVLMRRVVTPAGVHGFALCWRVPRGMVTQ